MLNIILYVSDMNHIRVMGKEGEEGDGGMKRTQEP